MLTTTLIVPGLNGSGPGHWQTWMQQRVADARRVEQDGWDIPVIARWARSVRRDSDSAPGALFLLAHSFGALAAVTAAVDRRERIAGALLVAPADPERFTATGLPPPYDAYDEPGIAADLPAEALGFPSLLAASADDPWLKLARAAWWAERWGSRFHCLGNAGHVNVDSGHGPWPEGLRLFEDLRRSQGGVPVGELPADSRRTPHGRHARQPLPHDRPAGRNRARPLQRSE